MATVHVLLPTVLKPGEVTRVNWFYNDKSEGDIIDPSGIVPFSARLLDIQGNNRAPTQTETIIGDGVTFTPAKDVDDSFYVDVDMTGHASAQPGLWTIEATFRWENQTRTLVLGVHVLDCGATITPPEGTCRYATHQDVSRFMFRNVQGFDQNTFLTPDDLDELILDAMDQIDSYTMRTFCTKQSTEVLDVTYSDKWRWHGDYIVHAQTVERPIVSIDYLATIQAGNKNEITADGPDREGHTWYTHDKNGQIFIIGSPIPSILRNGLEVTYTWGLNDVPRDIRKACRLLVAADILESENYAVELPEWSQTAGTVQDKVERWTNTAYDLLDRWRDIGFHAGGG